MSTLSCKNIHLYVIFPCRHRSTIRTSRHLLTLKNNFWFCEGANLTRRLNTPASSLNIPQKVNYCESFQHEALCVRYLTATASNPTDALPMWYVIVAISYSSNQMRYWYMIPGMGNNAHYLNVNLSMYISLMMPFYDHGPHKHGHLGAMACLTYCEICRTSHLKQ